MDRLRVFQYVCIATAILAFFELHIDYHHAHWGSIVDMIIICSFLVVLVQLVRYEIRDLKKSLSSGEPEDS